MARLAGKSAVVTGGARGIGEGIVRRFVAEGARCVIADIDVAAGEALAADLGDAVVFLRTDVTSEADIVAAIEACVSSFGALDVMVNNAGIVGVTGPIGETPLELPVMVRQGSGSIINTASTAGVQGGLGPHVYTTAKHGVIGLSKSVAVEAAPFGVRVNVLCPGATLSSLTAGLVTGDKDNLDDAYERLSSKYVGGRAPKPADMANAALFMASDESEFMNGAVMVVDAGKETLSDRAAKFYPIPTR
ncbi:MAG: SDR family oxidoreductase [Actinobacteria bacterium]|nr:SDR family oxidoreductase [Actinomycetota bacterium]